LKKLRLGMCGTGYWADFVHLPVLAASQHVELVGVHGRSAQTTRERADKFGIAAFGDFDDLLSQVDAVSFALPPSMQAAYAIRAAKAGKHLLLEKPVAATLQDADMLAAEVERRGLSSIVFLTRLFVAEARRFIDRIAAEKMSAGSGSFLSGDMLPGSPYSSSSWRQGEFGTLWDIGPHVLSILVPAMGPVVAISARKVREGRFACELDHGAGRKSTMTVDLKEPSVQGKGVSELYAFEGPAGRVEIPGFRYVRQEAFANAVAALAGTSMEAMHAPVPDVLFGRMIVAVLDAAQRSILSGGATMRPS